VVTTGEGGGGRDSPPSSPRLRQTTFGATLDFIEALCDASSRLTSFPPVRLLFSCAWDDYPEAKYGHSSPTHIPTHIVPQLTIEILPFGIAS
jgi:hypothetical protein